MAPARALLLWSLRLWLRSLRVRGPAEIPARAVLVLWHEDLPACMRAFADLGVHVLISRSRDGSLAAALCESLGYRVHRGSSSRGGLAGLKALARALGGEADAGNRVLAGMALDGPRGPRRVPKEGAAWLARQEDLPIYSIHVAARHALRLKTWDRTIIPLPFSRVDVSLSGPQAADPQRIDSGAPAESAATA